MITYLLNFTLCSALLLLAYHLVLKNKTMYTFNRFYLLLSILFSLTVPFIVVNQTTTPLPSLQPLQQHLQLPPDNIIQKEIPNQLTPRIHAITPHADINYTLYGLIAYSLITALLLYRFVKNLNTIRLSVLYNEHIDYNNARLILVNERQTPHTFLNFIFLNKDDYHNQQIENEVLKHEMTHARQYHSADIIFIELIKVFCWFNPVIALYRRAMQLNHEFIADAAVLVNNNNVSNYQQLLLSKLGYVKSLNITSQFNYSVTKKRLIMMTKNTSATTAMFARLTIVPVMAIAFILFCTKTEARQEKTDNQPVAQDKPGAKVQGTLKVRSKKQPPMVAFGNYPHTNNGVPEDKLKEYASITAKYEEGSDRSIKHPDNITNGDREHMEGIFKQMSLSQQQQQTISFFYMPAPFPPKQPTQKQLEAWKNPKLCGVWIDDKKAKNSDLENYKPGDFSLALISKLTKYAINYKNYKYQVNLMTDAYYKNYRANAIANKHKSYMAFRMLNRHSIKD